MMSTKKVDDYSLSRGSYGHPRRSDVSSRNSMSNPIHLSSLLACWKIAGKSASGTIQTSEFNHDLLLSTGNGTMRGISQPTSRKALRYIRLTRHPARQK
jgi:hypothetical protein